MSIHNNKVKGIQGPCCDDANKILNLSQGVSSQTQAGHLIGHPRYHVLCNRNHNKAEIINNLETLGCTEVVTDQQHNTKTAFLNRDDQNRTLHDILTSPQGRNALDSLNSGANEIVLKTPLSDDRLMLAVVSDGKKIEQKPAKSTVLILGHHQNKPEGMYVHVKTFYPVG